MLGRAFVEVKLVRELNRQAGTQVGATLDTYAKLCWTWARDVLDRQKARFDSYANRLRVRVQMAVVDTALSEDELQRIRFDLDRIPLARTRAVFFFSSLRQQGTEKCGIGSGSDALCASGKRACVKPGSPR